MASPYEVQKTFYQKNYLSSGENSRAGKQEEIRTSPLFSLAVKYFVDTVEKDASSGDSSYDTASTGSEDPDSLQAQPPSGPSSSPSHNSTTESNTSINTTPVLPQYGLLGFHVGSSAMIADNEPIMLNVDAPNSVFICGSQGSGKSYTLSAILENCLLKDSTVGRIDHPVAGVVFHYDVDSSDSIAEVAHLCSRGIKVDVLVSQSNERALRQAYERVGTAENRPTVRPPLLRSSDLSINRMKKLMALAEKEGPTPLYMEVVQRILRQMAIQGTTVFDYKRFRQLLGSEQLTKDQMSPMNLRFSLLESFMHPNDLPAHSSAMRPRRSPPSPSDARGKLFTLDPGTLTIIDLSDTFVDAATVCILFDICLGLIKAQRPPSGLIVALDEAHKFLTTSPAAATFTDRLLTTIREQRHNATRVIIATQEPTLSGRLLDLCSVSIVHRFTSPAWFAAIRQHLGGASQMLTSTEERSEMFERIVHLGVGESLVFCPAAWVGVGERERGVRKLDAHALTMKTRVRKGTDGGMSALASQG